MLGARSAVRAAAIGARLHSLGRRARRQAAAAVMAGDGMPKVTPFRAFLLKLVF